MQKSHLLLGLMVVTSFAFAEDLYDPAPPADSAFVRLINGTNSEATATLGTKKLTAKAANTSAYLVFTQGMPKLTFGKLTQDVHLDAGKFYTLALTGTSANPKVTVLEDAENTNRTRALINVYNLSTIAKVDLKTGDGKTAVIEGVTPGSSKSRAVNGIKVALSVYNGGKVMQAFKETQLERGAAYAVIVTDKGATWVQSTTSTK